MQLAYITCIGLIIFGLGLTIGGVTQYMLTRRKRDAKGRFTK